MFGVRLGARVFLALLGCTTQAVAVDRGAFTITVDGQEQEHRIVSLNETGPDLVSIVDRRTLRLGHGSYPNGDTEQGTRIWVSKDGRMHPDSYVNFTLLGKTLQYTIDLSRVDCRSPLFLNCSWHAFQLISVLQQLQRSALLGKHAWLRQ